ncbi:MAG: glycosyltransferase [Thermoplasmata archaeon]|nr:glycosyltransferase [Thermoplasmata archaeon]
MSVKIRVNYISTWNVKCGIAEYSKFLLDAMNQIGNIKINIFPVKNEKIEKFKNPFQYLKLAFNAGKNCDIVHIQYQPFFFVIQPFPLSYFPMILAILRLRSKARIVVTIHEFGNRNKLRSKLNMRFLERVVDLLIVHTPEHRQVLLQSGFKEERIVQIPQGTIVGRVLNKTECKNKLGLTGKKVLIVLGFISPVKGYDLVIKALPSLPKEVVLLIVGSPRNKQNIEYANQLKAIAMGLSVEERIKFIDFVSNEDLPVLVNAADIAIFPYRAGEGSAALNMALGFKVATITSDITIFKEIKQTYDCIEIFRKDDYQELSTVIMKLLSNQDKMQYLIENCNKFIQSTNWNAVASRTVDTYIEVMAGHPASMYEDKIQKERIDWLKENKEGSTLEIGCATGFITNYVNADVGLDIREDRITVARKRYPSIKFIEGDATNLPFEDNSFCTVMAPDTLEHVPQRIVRAIVDECMRVCSTNVLITMPNGDRKGYKHDRSIGGKNPEHLWPPTRVNVDNIFNGLRYEIGLTSSSDFLLIKVIKNQKV